MEKTVTCESLCQQTTAEGSRLTGQQRRQTASWNNNHLSDSTEQSESLRRLNHSSKYYFCVHFHLPHYRKGVEKLYALNNE